MSLSDNQKLHIAELLFSKHQGFLYPSILAKYIGLDEKGWLELLSIEKEASIAILQSKKANIETQIDNLSNISTEESKDVV